MRVPVSWLGEWVDLEEGPERICEILTGGGIETEVAADERPSWDGVVTAKLQRVEPHPNADKLTVTAPFDGSVEFTVVCGATNHKVGDIVALATHGTVLPGGFKIKKGKFRGVSSEGMLCSGSELGLSDEAEGILILPPDTPVGRPLAEVVEAGDVLLETEPAANRGDCHSMLGIARELSAVTGWELNGRASSPEGDAGATIFSALPVLGQSRESAGHGANKVTVELRGAGGCPRYTCAVMTGVEVGDSPSWMRDRLETMGVRSINNVVDCTNYVMLELGNPLHAFDRRSLRGGSVCIRRAEDGEVAVTLDGGEHRLGPRDLVIADAEGIIALAGVMGGENSEVRDDTTTLFLESAHFDPMTVRRTAHRCKLSTESSYRFARGVDPELPQAALLRLIELLSQCAGGELCGDIVDLYPDRVVRSPVDLRLHRIPDLLGFQLKKDEVLRLLVQAGLDPQERTGEDVIRVQPPSYRFDVEREVDVLEEIVRLYGYHRIPEICPSRPLQAVPRGPAGSKTQAVRREMQRLGLSECIHFSFIDPSWLVDLGLPEDHPWRTRLVAIQNPLSEVGGVLRPTLLPSLLRTAARARAMGSDDLRLFELRSTFQMREEGFEGLIPEAGGRPLDRSPVHEARTVAGLLAGRRAASGWSQGGETVDFFDIRACADALETLVGWRGYQWATADLPPFLHPGEGARLAARGPQGDAGWVGRIAAPALQAFGLDVVVYAFELNLDQLRPKKQKPFRFAPLSRFPSVERDLALLVPDAVPAAQILGEAKKVASKGGVSLQRVHLFDVYRGKGIPEGCRSLALRFTFRALDRTLEDKAVDSAMNQVGRHLEAVEGVRVRG